MSEGNFFFEAEGNRYHPTPRTRGPWDPQSLHGRVIAGLIAHQIEHEYGEPAFQPSRLTVDMFRVAPMKPMTVTTELVRDGNRIKVVDASMTDDEGTLIGRGNVVFLRRADQPDGEVWTPPVWSVPAPETVEPQPPPADAGEDWLPTWETRRITGDFGTVGPKAGVDPRDSRTGRGTDAEPVRACRPGLGLHEPVCQQRQRRAELRKRRHHALPPPRSGRRMDRHGGRSTPLFAGDRHRRVRPVRP